jgi:hypothetical protein
MCYSVSMSFGYTWKLGWIYVSLSRSSKTLLESSWNVMAHGDAREENWRGNKIIEWVASKRHMTAEHRIARAVQTLQADVHSSPASSRLNWRPCRLKWTRLFRRKTKSGFCGCAITFQKQSTTNALIKLKFMERIMSWYEEIHQADILVFLTTI